jgi:competence protein ComFB
MAFIDKYNLEHVVNEAERLVHEELGLQLESYEGEICLCNDCVADMAAMALNTVKPLYRYTLLGTLWASSARSDAAYDASVREAVSNAIEKIRGNPSHD